MNFKPVKEKKVYEKIIDQIEEMISKGQLKKGDKLPSERELTKTLEVSRASLREAFSALKMIGLIERHHGQGTFLKKNINDNFLKPLSILFMLEDNMEKELIELRRLIEITGVKYASWRASEEEINKLQEYTITMKKGKGNAEISRKADKDFHYTLAKATRNNLVYKLLQSISDVIDAYLMNVMEKITKNERENEIFINQHYQIYEAVAAGNDKLAQQKMQEHLDWAESLLEF